MEDKEPLKTGAVISNMSNFIENLIDQLLADGIVTTSVVIRGILLARNHLLRVE